MKLLLSWLLFLNSASAIASTQLREVNLRMQGVPNTAWIPYEIGIQQGYFREEGIDLKLSAAQGAHLVVNAVGSGQSLFGITGAEFALLGRSKGAPVQVIAVLLPVPVSGLYSLEEAGIRKPKDVEGKRIATTLRGKYAFLMGFIKKNGLDLQKIRISTVGTDNLNLLYTGEYDAIVHVEHEANKILKRKPKPYREMKFRDHGLDELYSTSLVTNDQTIRSEPELVRKMVRAVQRSWKYAAEHPKEAELYSLKLHPEINPEEAGDFETVVKAALATPDARKYGIGFHSKAGWTKMKEFLLEMNTLNPADHLNLDEAFNVKFLDPAAKPPILPATETRSK